MQLTPKQTEETEEPGKPGESGISVPFRWNHKSESVRNFTWQYSKYEAVALKTPPSIQAYSHSCSRFIT